MDARRVDPRRWHFDDYTIIIFDADYDLYDDNIDINVELKSGERYGATLFTLNNIHTLMARHFRSGESNDGQFFWCSDPVIVLDLTEKTILDLVAYLVKSGELEMVFDHYKDEKKPSFGELHNRLREDLKRYNGKMPREAALAWHGYLSCLLEYNLLPREHIQQLKKRLPPLEDPSVLDVFLNPPDENEGS